MSVPRTLCVSLALLLALAGCGPAVSPAAAPAATTAAPVTRVADAPDRFFDSGDARIRYRDLGRGEPIVLVHGFGGSLEWPRSADSLAVDHRVVVLDVRGFGQSSRFDDPSRFGAEMVEDLARLLDHLGLRRAHVAGHSMGAVLAANLAQRHPERVATLTLIGGPFFADSAAAARRVGPWIAGLERGERLRPLFSSVYPMWSDSTVTAVSDRTMARNDSTAMLAVMRSLPALAVAPAGGTRMRMPTLAIVGTEDPLLAESAALARWWPGARLRAVDGANHGDILVHPVLLQEMRALVRARER
jgi:pimeloyl-ACP methyl ester carboxylesterase